jgi:hypothetical protein
VLDTATELGIAAAPFTVVLGILGAWATRDSESADAMEVKRITVHFAGQPHG